MMDGSVIELDAFHVDEVFESFAHVAFLAFVEDEGEGFVVGGHVKGGDQAAGEGLAVLQGEVILQLAGGVGFAGEFLDVAAAFLEVPFLFVALPEDDGFERFKGREGDVAILLVLFIPEAEGLFAGGPDLAGDFLAGVEEENPAAGFEVGFFRKR